MNELLSIEWKNLNDAQLLYVQTEVVPKIEDVLCGCVRKLLDLASEPQVKPLCSRDCANCMF